MTGRGPPPRLASFQRIHTRIARFSGNLRLPRRLGAVETPYSSLSEGNVVGPKLYLCVVLGAGILAAAAGCVGSHHARESSAAALSRGHAALAAGDHDAARGIFTAIARNAPTSVQRGEAFLGLGRVELADGHPGSAIPVLQRAESLLVGNPAQQSVELLLADSFLRVEKWDQARRHLENAFAYLEAGYQRQRCAYLLSLLYERAGRDRKAQSYWGVAGGRDLPEYAEWRERILPTPTPVIVQAPPKVVRAKPRPVAAKLKVFPRKTWKAKETRGNVNRMEAPRKITVHHTGEASLPNFRTKKDVQDYLLTLQRSHQKHKGWADIGYHYLIDRWGNIWEGRPAHFQGAHAGSPTTNKRNIGVALIGNFEDHEPPRAQWNTLRRFVNDLRSRYRISSSAVYSHRKLKENAGLQYTDCPGRHVLRLMPTLVAATSSESPASSTPLESAGSAEYATSESDAGAGCFCHPPRRLMREDAAEHRVAH